MSGARTGAPAASGGSASDGFSSPADASEGASSPQSKPGVAPAALLADRRLVMTASLEVRVASATQSAARVRALVAQAGGYIANEETSSTPPGDTPTPEPQPMDDTAGGSQPSSAVGKAVHNPSATSLLTVRVPSAQLSSLTDQVAALGTVTQRSQASQDVTQQSVDVASRLATQRASIARIRVLLAKADRIGDIVNIEGELSRREADLESMQAQLKSLNDSVELATLSVALVPRTATPEKSDDNGFVAGLRNGWDAFTGALVVGLTVVGAVLPFAVALAAARHPGRLGLAPAPRGDPGKRPRGPVGGLTRGRRHHRGRLGATDGDGALGPACSGGLLVHQVDDPGQHVGVGVGRHPVAQVEHVPGLAASIGQHALDPAPDRVPRRERTLLGRGCPAPPGPARPGGGPRPAAPGSRCPRRRHRPAPIAPRQLAGAHPEVDPRHAEVGHGGRAQLRGVRLHQRRRSRAAAARPPRSRTAAPRWPRPRPGPAGTSRR